MWGVYFMLSNILIFLTNYSFINARLRFVLKREEKNAKISEYVCEIFEPLRCDP